MISSQEFRNAYEKFYDAMRLYLWPYDTLEILAEVEADIYSTFIDRYKLSSDFYKLHREIKDVLNEDKEFEKTFSTLQKLVDAEDEDSYSPLTRVEEKRQEKNKVLKNPEQIEKEEKERKEEETLI